MTRPNFIVLALKGMLHPGRPHPRWAEPARGVLIGIGLLIAYFVTAGIIHHDDSGHNFSESKPGTTATVVLFLAAAAWSWSIWYGLHPHKLARFWLVAALGFVWLAIDDQFKGHETLDIWINHALGRDPEGSKAADDLDVLIVAIYFPIAAALAWPHRSQLCRLRWALLCTFAATGCFGVMVWIDWRGGLDAVEESAKLLAATLLALAVGAARIRLLRRGWAISSSAPRATAPT
jgi:hypothetical protein